MDNINTWYPAPNKKSQGKQKSKKIDPQPSEKSIYRIDWEMTKMMELADKRD